MTNFATGRQIGTALVLGLLVACATNPVTGRRELSLVSESQEVGMGQQAAAEVRQSMGLVPDSGLQAYVRSVAMPMAKASERPQLPWSFEVVDDPAVNAFALPGGPIFVTRGILAYMQNEAELASVLGHEIGHVTAKHSVQQISKSQLAQLGLGVGSIVSPEFAALSGIVGQGLGLLMLKYGRDAETQADDLGFKYSLADGYDVRATRTMFEMLQRVSGGTAAAGRLPQWLSTHPDPENRIAKTDQRLATVTTDLRKTKLNRDPFLRQLDGLVYGDNPRQGYFDGSRFNHPDLAFRIDYPAGWKTQNQPSAVVGVSAAEDAIFALSIPSKDTPDAALSAFLGQQGIQASGASRSAINGFPAASADFQAQTQDGNVVGGRITFLSYGGNTYQLIGYTLAKNLGTHRGTFVQTIQSFNRLTDQTALGKQPARIRLVRLSRDMTVEEFYRQNPSTVPLQTVAIMNGANAVTDVLKSGTWAKRVQ
ncbi:MAG: M48 family metalloprotease [Gemmatimonadales bacterium]